MDDISYVIIDSGNDQINGIKLIPIIAYKLPAAFNAGSIPNGPPLEDARLAVYEDEER